MNNFIKLNWITSKIFIIFIAIIYSILFISNAEPYVRSDGFCYYHIAKSIINEGSFVSANKPEYWDYMGHVKERFNGKYISVCAPGAPLMMLPGLVVANVIDSGKNIENDYFIAYNGHSLEEGLSILFTSSMVGLLSIILIYKTLRRVGINKKVSIISLLLVILGSYVLGYVLLMPAFTHIYEVFAVSLILYSIVSIIHMPFKRYFILLGIGVGLSVIIRPVLLPIGIFAILYALFRNLKFSSSILKESIYICLGGLPFLILYLVYNYVSYGSLVASGYSVVRNEGFGEFNFFNLLFSFQKGWFVFSPIYLIAILGLALKIKDKKLLSLFALLSIFSVALIYGFWHAWWGGGSYGSRFMLFALPFGALGIAFLINSITKFKKPIRMAVVVITAIFTVFSALLTIGYRFTPLGTPLYTPATLIKHQIKIIQSSDSVGSYFNNLYKNIPEGSGLLAFLLGISDNVMRVENDNSNLIFRIYRPPISTQQFSERIKVFISNKELGVIEGYIVLDQDTNEYLIDLNHLTGNKNLEVVNGNSKVTQLDISRFTGINLGTIQIYLENGMNFQFRGNIIPWDIEQKYYDI